MAESLNELGSAHRDGGGGGVGVGGQGVRWRWSRRC